MRIIEAERKPVHAGLIAGAPSEAHCREVVAGDTLVTEGGRVTAAYFELNCDPAAIVAALGRIKVGRQRRTLGLETISRGFGFSTRNPIRANFCSGASLALESPEDHAAVCEYGRVAAECYRKADSALFAAHVGRAAAELAQDYRIEGTPFTSGNINKNRKLAYHFDKGNLPGVWSACFVFRAGCDGGRLICPELNLGFASRHNSVFLFDGQKTLHGVTPIVNREPGAYRTSVVFYSLTQMWKCIGPEGELERARREQTAREDEKIGRAHTEEFGRRLAAIDRAKTKQESGA